MSQEIGISAGLKKKSELKLEMLCAFVCHTLGDKSEVKVWIWKLVACRREWGYV